MLSRTAENLFWMSRYVERAESLARILYATSRIAATPSLTREGSNEWESALRTASVLDEFSELYDEANEANVLEFLAFSPENPSSIRSCLERARINARAVRTALTIEIWEAINSSWIELRKFERSDFASRDLSRFINWVKEVSVRVDGSAYRTMLRNDAFYFSRLGVYLERADNTARILDVKYHILLPESEPVGGGVDYYQWSSLLRAVSAHTAYHWIYRDAVKPWNVADLLILRREMPRSMARCYENMVNVLDAIARAYGRQGPSQRLVRRTHGQLLNVRIDDVFQNGMHEFLSGFIDDNNALGQAITDQYLS
ncbi:MAG: alpha-E domain-containing protein [Rhodobiaceae bacterium]|nr:alpha-E domain-containing protein [Rhodobiaceae bacterium]MCC0055854.1 alpha-E domain-containing protein [Rhodobiaceae bacterium]